MLDSDIYDKWTYLNNTFNNLLIDYDILWNNQLEKLKYYIDENKILPSNRDSNIEIKHIANWMYHQLKFKNKNRIIRNEEINKKFNQFIIDYNLYFIDCTTKWNNKLKNLIDFINQYKSLPSAYDKNEDIKLIAKWYQQNKNEYKNNKMCKKHVNTWSNFIQEYSQYFNK